MAMGFAVLWSERRGKEGGRGEVEGEGTKCEHACLPAGEEVLGLVAVGTRGQKGTEGVEAVQRCWCVGCLGLVRKD